MRNRLKELRNCLGFTQQEFCDNLGIARGNLAKWESSEIQPSAATITLICKEYHVNESWLRTGEGEMFVPKTRKQQVEDYMGALLNGERTELEEALIETMAETTIEEWRTICELFRRLAEKMKKPDA